jgi:hypothetical protein
MSTVLQPRRHSNLVTWNVADLDQRWPGGVTLRHPDSLLGWWYSCPGAENENCHDHTS